MATPCQAIRREQGKAQPSARPAEGGSASAPFRAKQSLAYLAGWKSLPGKVSHPPVSSLAPMAESGRFRRTRQV